MSDYHSRSYCLSCGRTIGYDRPVTCSHCGKGYDAPKVEPTSYLNTPLEMSFDGTERRVIIVDADQNDVAVVLRPFAHGVAERMSACVNACADMDDPAEMIERFREMARFEQKWGPTLMKLNPSGIPGLVLAVRGMALRFAALGRPLGIDEMELIAALALCVEGEK